MIPYCKFNGIGIIPWGPLCDGHLARPLGTETSRKELTKGRTQAPALGRDDHLTG